MTVLSARALNRATLARQMLLERARITPVKAIERLAGMQAQVPKPPFIGLWTRLENFRRADLQKLIARGEVVRGTLMRGTLHLVAKKDYGAWRPALQPMLSDAQRSIAKQRADESELERVLEEARTFFSRGACTFEVLRDHLVGRFPKGNDRLMGYAARMHLPLVMVADDSTWSYPSNSQFALADVARANLHDLALRYVAAFGPASVADFQTWSGVRDARPLFDELRPKLQTFRDERGRELFDLPRAPRPDADVVVPVRFLPEYDNILLAWSDRTRIISDDHRPRVATKNLRILATFLVDGRVAGTWSITRKSKVATLKLEPFVKLTRAVRDELVAEGERLVRFVEEDVEKIAVSG